MNQKGGMLEINTMFMATEAKTTYFKQIEYKKLDITQIKMKI